MKGMGCLIVFFVVVLLFLMPDHATAVECEVWVARVVAVEGAVQARRAGKTEWQQVRYNDFFCPGDMIRVQGQSRAEIVLSNSTILRLDQKTTVTFSRQEREEDMVLMELINGAIHFFSRIPRSLNIITPAVNAAVKGTEAFIRADGDETLASVFEGEVSFDNEAGGLNVGRGQSALAKKGRAPVLVTVVRPREAVQWTLYYPPVVHYRTGEFPAGLEDWQTGMRKSLEFYHAGRLEQAFGALAVVGEGVRDPRFFIYRASLLLSVGRVQEARSDIEKALDLSPGNGDALALQSVIAVAQNDGEQALSLARKAVETDPKSSSARVAISYALQARFDLKGALESLREAVKLDPENPLVFARLAELHQSFGNLDESLSAAEKAVSLNPHLSRTQSVLGFAHLSRIETARAREAFAKAIEYDQADPLPRLGMGLAVIRDGDLKQGRGEIEIAAGLNPDNSLIRSYLGKAYHEEKRDDKAVPQFSAAEEFDPLDPTPWFYEAIQKQSVNRPVEALRDIQKAIALNDNRAVYRSRFLLDSDLAARSASLGRIYSDLGFQQLALVEGWKSVNTDPSNFSAHRFLSDSYSGLPRHEIAKVSELLQSQLLQPINITPVQPSLGEANLLVLAGAGPSDTSFNEFNPLFNRNRIALQLSGVAGDNSTLGDEVVLSGVQGKYSFSLGQFHYETDGFRKNDDQHQDIYDLFAQVSLSPRTSVQAEFRYRDVGRGDLTLRFDPEDFLQNLRQSDETKTARIGFHHSFAPGSDLIVNAAYQHLKEDTHNKTPVPPSGTFTLDEDIKQEGYLAEVQHLLRLTRFNLVSGGGYFSADQQTRTKGVIEFGPFGPPVPPQTSLDREDRDLRHANLYVYSQVNYPDTVVITLGASADFFNGGLIDRDQFNPKIGVTWNVLPSTTVRAALFRTLTRSLINSQTLEPTQVAGFNQFFDDTDGTETWRYGIALDQKFSQDLSGGIEYSQRDLKVPFQSFVQPAPDAPFTVEIQRVDWHERSGRAYLYWTPHRWFSLSGEYYYEKFDRDKEFIAGIEQLKTHRFPLGLNFYHPSGLFANLRATYIDQEGKFLPQLAEFGAPATPGSDSFWLFDASVGYRLPRRLGIISVVAKNLFDTSFKFQDTDFQNPAIQPGRAVFMKVTMAF